MPHARQQIRESIVSALSGLSIEVYDNFIGAHSVLPSLNVNNGDETIREDMGAMDDIQIREIHYLVEGRVEDAQPEDELDTIADDVIDEVLEDTTVKSLVWDIKAENLSFSYSKNGNKPVGMFEFNFVTLYQINRNDPTNIIT